MKQQPFVIERTVNAPVERVWKAITDKKAMKEWYFDLKEFKAEPGFEFRFTGGKEIQYLHICVITEVEVNKKLQYSWRYDGYEGISYVTFNLFREGNKTKIVLTHEGLESFPANNPDFAKKNFEKGWNQIIGKSLPEYVEKEVVNS